MPRSMPKTEKVIPIRKHAPTPVPELESPTPQPLASNKLLLTPHEAADALSINRSTLYGDSVHSDRQRTADPSVWTGRVDRRQTRRITARLPQCP